MSKQFGRLALGPQSHGENGEVSAKSLAPRASSISARSIRGERGKWMGQGKGDEEEDGRKMRERKQRLSTGYYRGSGHGKKVQRMTWVPATS